MKTALLLASLLLPVAASAASPPPNATTIVIIGCRVDDHTGEPGRQDPAMAAKNWRDLEWHINASQQLECQREVIPLQDAVMLTAPPGEARPLHPNFADHSQCAGVAMSYSPTWEKAHPGWAVMAVGCPSPVGVLPACPSRINGYPIKCLFDPSMI